MPERFIGYSRKRRKPIDVRTFEGLPRASHDPSPSHAENERAKRHHY